MLEALAGIIAPFTAEAYYVGGCVRDCLLGRPIKDVDIAVAADPKAVGKAVQQALGGHFFWLRERDGTARVFRHGPDSLQVDIVLLREPIEEDLRRRDYTVNAMALPVAAGLDPHGPLLDPTGGQADLAARRLRLAGEGALEADPLRALRGVRLAVQLGFEMEAATAARVREAGPWLERVSRERIRDEFFLCLASRESIGALGRLQEFDLLEHAVPELRRLVEGGRWSAALGLAAAVEHLIDTLPFPPALADAVRAHLGQALTPLRGRRELLELGALLWHLPAEAPGEGDADGHPKGTPLRRVGGAGARLGQQLALSGAEAAWVERLLAHRPALAAWLRSGASLGRDVYRLWQAAGNAAADIVLVTLADPEQGLPASEMHALLARLLEYERGEHAPLLTGQEVMAATGLTPGPELGQLLQEMAEAQADGLFRTPEEAREWLRRRKRE